MAIGTPTVLADFVESTASAGPTLTGITIPAGVMIVVIAHVMTGAASFATADGAVEAVDSAGNTYTLWVAEGDSGHNSGVAILTAPCLFALSSGTITLSYLGSYKSSVNVSYWPGVAAVGTGLVNGTNTGSTATTSPAACAVTVAESGDAVIGGISYGSTTAPSAVSSGFSEMGGSSPATSFYGANAYDIVSSTGTHGPAWTTPSTESAAATVVLRPGSLNLLSNWSFETNPSGLAAGWTDENTTATEPTYTQTTSGVVDGTYAQSIVYAGEGTDTGTQKIEVYQSTSVSARAVAPGNVCTFSLWVSGSVTNAAPFIGLEAFNESSQYLGEVDTYFTPTGTPQQVSATYVLPPNAVRVAVYLQVPELYSTSEVNLDIDDASLAITGQQSGGGLLTVMASA